MPTDLLLLLPLGAALLYTIGTLFLKRVLEAGVGSMRTTFVANLAAAVFFLPLLFFSESPLSLPLLGYSVAGSLLFFGGQVFTFLAVDRGDVSVATPLMGTKVLFVGFFSVVFLGSALALEIWIGAALCVLAVLLLRGESAAERKRLLPAILFGIASAASYAAADVFVQKAGQQFGFAPFVPLMFGLLPVWSLALIPFFQGKLTAIKGASAFWLWLGALILALQAAMMAAALAGYGNATLVNILYSSRGIWSVVLVWFAGALFAVREQNISRGVLIRRLAGSLLLVLAVVVALEGKN